MAVTQTLPPQVQQVINSITSAQKEPENPDPKITICEVGPFRLPGVAINTDRVTAEELAEMQAWARENHAYVADNVISWRRRDLAKRDWFTLRWS